MSIDTYGLPSEQYEEFFEDNIRFAAQLYLKTCNILSTEGAGSVDFKTVLDMYQENVYATNDDCRRYQKSNNPEALKDTDLLGIYPSREELLAEIQAVNAKMDMVQTLVTYTEALDAKLEALTDYVSNLVAITTAGLEGIATTLDETVD